MLNIIGSASRIMAAQTGVDSIRCKFLLPRCAIVYLAIIKSLKVKILTLWYHRPLTMTRGKRLVKEGIDVVSLHELKHRLE
jgi:hypothetical protein